MGPNGALRSGSVFPESRMKQAEANKQREDDKVQAEYRGLMEIASLANHPGWKRVVKDFETAIANYRSGKAIAAIINSAPLDNARIGEETKVCYRMAEELESLLQRIQIQSDLYEQRRQARKNERVPTKPLIRQPEK